MEEYLTSKEALAVLKCSRTSLWKLVKAKKIRQFKLSYSQSRYLKQDLLDYIKSCEESKD